MMASMSDRTRAITLALSFLMAGCVTTNGQGTGLVISGQSNREYRGLKISTKSGSCVTIVNSTNITIRESQIGPCGTSSGLKHGISVQGSTGIRIYDSYIHPEHRATKCCDTGNGIFLTSTSDVTIQGNVIAFGESNVQAVKDVSGLKVIGNFLLNPQGPFPRGLQVQAWYSRDVLVEGNYTLSSNDPRYGFPQYQEDALNFGNGSGFVVRNNYVQGGTAVSGCGILADDGADDVLFENNAVLDTSGCGIGIASGVRQVVRGNKVLSRTPQPKAGNTALYVWKQYPQKPCGPTEIVNNIATTLRADGTQSGYWNGGGCDPVTLDGNVWDRRAQLLLEPVATKLPPPAIPPRPFACAARSPFTNQTGVAACR